MDCRIIRQSARTTAGADPATAKALPAWAAQIDRSLAFGVSWDERNGPVPRFIVTAASFPFDPAIDGDEADALERARAYCVDVAAEVAGLRPALEGFVARVEGVIADAVRQHRAVPSKFH